MSVFEKPRWGVFTQRQHPLVHSLSDFFYSNPALPGVTNIESALNWAFKILYPTAQASVANPAALPTLGNTLNDYRVVLDDGDGNAAGYRWEQREGDASPSWYKVYDFDWSSDAILAAFTDKTQDMYVWQKGKSDLDVDGNVVTGIYAGQTIFGGNLANQHLTLSANSGDYAGTLTEVLDISYTSFDNFGSDLNAVTRFRGQGFLPTQTGDISKVVFSLTKASGLTVGDIVVDIYDDNAGEPGTIIATSDPVDLSTIPSYVTFPGSFAEIEFPFSTSVELVGGNTYYCVLNASAATFPGALYYLLDSGDPDNYEDGYFWSSDDSGANWTGAVSDDIYFKIYLSTLSFAQTGYVQVRDNFRPTADNTLDVGTATEQFKTLYLGTSALISTLTLATGSITDTTGTIDFDNENLVTTGNITGTTGYFITSIEVGPLAGSALVLEPGLITDESGQIDFDDENLVTAGTVTGASGSVFGDITLGTGSITSASATISFGTNNLSTSGTIGGGAITGTSVAADNLLLDGNTLSATNLNGNVNLLANGTGVVDIQSAATTLGITATGTVTVTGQLNADNLRLDGNVLSATNVNGNVTLTPNGTGTVEVTSSIVPNVDASHSIGTGLLRFVNLFLSGSIGDGTTTITQATLQSLRDINSGVGIGYSLFWDGSKWASSLPDTEITHNTLSGLTTGDAGHTQFALLAGRAGGQDLIGGTAANNNLTLESTSNVTKGSILTKDHFRPFTDASFAVTWQGTDLGGASNYFRDLYTKGEAHGLRIENFTTAGLPSPSVQNVGRLVFDTDLDSLYIDTGTLLKKVGQNTFISDTVWNGSDTTKDVTVSSTITDARNAIWALHDNSNDFEHIYTNIKAISASVVRITVSPALPAGSFRLIGIEA